MYMNMGFHLKKNGDPESKVVGKKERQRPHCKKSEGESSKRRGSSCVQVGPVPLDNVVKSSKRGGKANNTSKEGENHKETSCHVPKWEVDWKYSRWNC